MNKEHLNLNAKIAQKVNWFNLPRALAMTLFTIADTLVEILHELKISNELKKARK